MFCQNVLILIIKFRKESPKTGWWIKNCSEINNFNLNTVKFYIRNEKTALKIAQSMNKETQKISNKKWLKNSINQFSNKLKYMRRYTSTITVRRNKFNHVPPGNMWGEKVNWVMQYLRHLFNWVNCLEIWNIWRKFHQRKVRTIFMW